MFSLSPRQRYSVVKRSTRNRPRLIPSEEGRSGNLNLRPKLRSQKVQYLCPLCDIAAFKALFCGERAHNPPRGIPRWPHLPTTPISSIGTIRTEPPAQSASNALGRSQPHRMRRTTWTLPKRLINAVASIWAICFIRIIRKISSPAPDLPWAKIDKKEGA